MLNKMENQQNIDEQIMKRLRSNSENIIETAKIKAKRDAELIKKNAVEEASRIKNQALTKCKTDISKKITDASMERVKNDALMELKLNSVNNILKDLKNSLDVAKNDTKTIQNQVQNYATNVCKLDHNKVDIEDALKKGYKVNLNTKNKSKNLKEIVEEFEEDIDEEMGNLDTIINNNIEGENVEAEDAEDVEGEDAEDVEAEDAEESGLHNEKHCSNDLINTNICKNPIKIRHIHPHGHNDPVSIYKTQQKLIHSN